METEMTTDQTPTASEREDVASKPAEYLLAVIEASASLPPSSLNDRQRAFWSACRAELLRRANQVQEDV